MSKNLIPKIAELLGVELGEEFKLDICGDDIFQITESGIWMRKGIDKEEWVEKPFEFVMLCNGDAEVIKLPWKPKENEKYWTFDIVCLGNTLRVVRYRWNCDFNDLTKLKVGWVYRTRAEAEATLPTVAKEMGVEYEI